MDKNRMLAQEITFGYDKWFFVTATGYYVRREEEEGVRHGI